MGKPLIGIFGGSFNPIHIGHVRAAIEVAEALGLAGVEFVPAAHPPHKSDESLLAFPLRVALCRAALAGLPGFSVNTMEAERCGPSYTWDTLTALRTERPGDGFCFIIGMADLLHLASWKNGLRLGQLCHLAVHAREGLGLEDFTCFVAANAQAMEAAPTTDPMVWALPQGHRLHFLPVTRLDVSASDIRERWLRCRRIEGLVCESVLHELKNHVEALKAGWGRSVSV